MDETAVELVVDSVRVHGATTQHVVVLREVRRERYLPIWIGQWEANAIAMRLQGVAPERPLTHDLFARTLAALGARLERVTIHDLTGDTFRATMLLDGPAGRHEVDARPSDALALAVRVDAPIFAAPAVLARAGVEPVAEREAGADDRLTLFRDFVNSLGDEAGGAGSPFVERDPDPGF